MPRPPCGACGQQRQELDQWRRRVSIGDTLAAARSQAGLTISQVSQRTCIRETIIRGIERGDFSACGGDFYARGHIRSIARVVGTDPEELIREYDATHAPPQPITARDVFEPFTPVKLKERRRPNWSLVLLVGLVAVLAVVGFRYFDSHHTTSPSAAASLQDAHKPKGKTKPAASPTPSASATPSGIRLVLLPHLGGVSWAEITTTAGRVVYQGDVYSRVVRTENNPMTVRIGNPAGIEVWLNGVRQPINTVYAVTLTCSDLSCTLAAPSS
jgi:transcriptional regulator with XRE-family HTH domain